MKPKTLVLMIVAVGCGLVASFMTSRYLAAQQNQPVVQEEKVPVLVAKTKITAYTVLNDAELFEVKNFDKSSVTKDVVGDFEKIKGRRLKNTLTDGKPLAESDLVDPEQLSLEYKLNPGEVAMTVKLPPEDMVGGFIMPGSRVDVVATQTRSTNQGDRPYSKVILQNVEVLATNAQMAAPENVSNQQIDRVTLRLTRKQAEQIAIFADTGKLKLLMRRADDPNIEDVGVGTDQKGPRYSTPEEAAGPSLEQQHLLGGLQAPTVPDNAKPEVTPEEVKKNSKLRITGADSKGVRELEYKDGTEAESPKKNEKEKK